MQASKHSEIDLFQKRLETEEQLLRTANQLLKRWEQRITVRNLDLADGFLNFELKVLLHVRIKESGKVWVICFEPVRTPVPEPISNEKVVPFDSEKGSVLVDVIKLVQSPQKLISTLVRFEVVDVFYRQFPHALYFSGLVGFVSGNVLKNRERSIFGRFPAGNDYKLTREMVEGASQIVDNIPSGRENVEWQDGQVGKIRRSLIASKYVQAVVTEIPDIGLQVEEVLFGPLNFYSNKDEAAFRV